jgi:hypothetical protein
MKEIFQELLLHGLSEINFFENNVFHGGTCKRLIYGSDRHSEDLDFNMKNNDPNFSWVFFFNKLNDYTKRLGFELILKPKETNDNGTVKRLTIDGKNMIDIIHNKGIVPINLTRIPRRRNIQVKIETGFYNSKFNSETKTLSVPEIFNIKTFDIHCLFAGKLHAVLTRNKKVIEKDKNTGETIRKYYAEENKGRDWYDLMDYIKEGIEPNWRYLKEKLKEKGPWKGQEINVNEEWLKEQLSLKTERLDYNKMTLEMADFLKADDEFIFNKDIAKKHIDMMGKGGYKIKCKKDDDDVKIIVPVKKEFINEVNMEGKRHEERNVNIQVNTSLDNFFNSSYNTNYSPKQISECLYTSMVNTRKVFEKVISENYPKEQIEYSKGYNNVLSKACDNIYNFFNNGENDKNYLKMFKLMQREYIKMELDLRNVPAGDFNDGMYKSALTLSIVLVKL